MAEFSSQAQQTIAAFAESMMMNGVPRPAADGSYTFLFEKSGTLTLIPASDGRNVILAVGRRPAIDDVSTMRVFFGNAGLEVTSTGPLHAGIAPNGDYYYAVVIPNGRFNLPTLETALNECFAAHDAVA